MYDNAQQMLNQQLQNILAQMNNLAQQANNLTAMPAFPSSPGAQSPTAVKQEPRKILYVRGIEGAKEEQQKLNNGESVIAMDDSEPVFYALSKDEDGKSPRRILIGRFTMEDEPDPPKYVTQEDFKTEIASFKADILDAIKGGKA